MLRSNQHDGLFNYQYREQLLFFCVGLVCIFKWKIKCISTTFFLTGFFRCFSKFNCALGWTLCECECVCVFIRISSNGNTCLFMILLMNCLSITKWHHKPISICCVRDMHWHYFLKIGHFLSWSFLVLCMHTGKNLYFSSTFQVTKCFHYHRSPKVAPPLELYHHVLLNLETSFLLLPPFHTYILLISN